MGGADAEEVRDDTSRKETALSRRRPQQKKTPGF
jgi:hypothetical protein